MSEIKTSLKNAWLHQLLLDWSGANITFFKQSLKAPKFEITSSIKTIGQWIGGNKRTICLSEKLILKYPWEFVCEVLYHEMAHQYVEEALNVVGDYPHGATFKKVCLERGIDHTATGNLEEWVENRHKTNHLDENQKLLNKIHKLLALAESKNLHEAESAMNKAQELLLRHNLSLLEVGQTRKYSQREIGEIKRKNPIGSIISTILNKFFFVETIWVYTYDQHKNKHGRRLKIFGAPENIDIAEYAHDFLLSVSETLWKTYKKENGITLNKHRRTFIYGILNGFYGKLEKQEKEKEATALVWVGDPELNRYFRKRNPRIRRKKVSYTRSCGDVYQSGKEVGEKLTIHKGVKSGSSSQGRFLK